MNERAKPPKAEQTTLELGLDPPAGAFGKAIAELVEPLAGLTGRSPFDIDCAAAAIAAAAQMVGYPGDAGTDTAAFQNLLLTEIVAQASKGREEFVAAVEALRTYGGSLSAATDERIQGLDLKPSLAAGVIGTAQVISANRYRYLPGDVVELVLELSYPDSDERPALAFLLDVSNGMLLRAATAFDDIEQLRAEVGASPDLEAVEDLRVGEALAAISHGLWVLDSTIGADQLVEDEEVFLLRPLFDHVLDSQPHLEVEYPTASDEERAGVVEAFVAWVASEAPHLSATAELMTPLMVDFAVDEAGGDPRRWSPMVAIRFLESVGTRAIVDPVDLIDVPDLTREMVRWSHELNGWPASVTADAITAIDEVESLFEAALEGLAGMTGPSAADADDAASHPEPFDPSGIDAGVLDRAESIAEQAATAAQALFDDEYVSLVRRLTADAARHEATVFTRGQTDIWASAVVYAVAQLNDIPGGWNRLAVPAAELTDRLVGASGTITNKARELRQLLDVDRNPTPDRYQHSASRFDPSIDLIGLIAGSGEPGLAVLSQIMAGTGQAPSSPFGALAAPTERPPAVDPASIDGDFFSIRAVIDGTRPAVWRRVRLPIDATFGQLHQLLQVTFGWYDCHLHAFDVNGMRLGPDPGGEFGVADIDEAEVRLCDLLHPGAEVVYTYDFGDNWEHLLEVEALQHRSVGEDLPDFACLAGARACPPEDCGGVWGYQELLAALKDRNHPDRAELVSWLPEGFNPQHFDAASVNGALRRWPT
ncbi:MAG: plasmid pRiA4b ORF-3 family protein [Acidimicrobiia bacterium]|nr:plasmid pRiA4b ORF-3 family protein [Acidimicrobiia bacterium]